MDLTLVIGNKNYSSWSLRAWLVLKQAEIPFQEIRISLYKTDSHIPLRQYSPSGKVPVLIDGDLTVWDSLAICEYLADKFPEKQLWPSGQAARTVARSVVAEMHAGFSALRQHMPMNIRRRCPDEGLTPESLQDIKRINTLWNDCRARFGRAGEFLFGSFCIADAMYAPVALRFITYEVKLDDVSAAYVNAITALPAVRQWIVDAHAETEIIPSFEPTA